MIVVDGIPLPGDLLWSDEWTSASVAQSVRRTLDGGLVVFYGERRAGLPITLASQADAGWLTRSQVDALALRAASPGAIYTFSLRGRTWPVMFRHHEPPAFEASPVIPLAYPQAGDFYLATLKFLTL